MDNKPLHFDGSAHGPAATEDSTLTQPFVLTDEARLSIGRNPYALDQGE